MTTRPRKHAEKIEERAVAAVAADPTPPAQQITIRHKMPELPSYWYDGTNAVAVAQWLGSQGTAAQVVFPTAPNALPFLVDPASGIALATEVYVLPSMETVDLVSLGANYDVL